MANKKLQACGGLDLVLCTGYIHPNENLVIPQEAKRIGFNKKV